jgi:hypothetical protein
MTPQPETPQPKAPQLQATGATFLSYDPLDIDRVHAFLDTHGASLGEMRTVGVTLDDPIARAHDEQHILDEIARRYVADAQLTLVLVGQRTWTRRFVDWEVAAAASNGCAILAVPLHPITPPVPARLQLLAESGGATIASHPPTSTAELTAWIEAACCARAGRLTSTPRAMRTPLMQRDAVPQTP